MIKQKERSIGAKSIGNRTIIGIICIVAALAICFGVAPLVNRLNDGKTEIVRVSQTILKGSQIGEGDVEVVKVGSFNLPSGLYAKKEDVEEFLKEVEKMNTPRERQNVEAVLQVSVKANDELYREIRRDANMCDALRELMKDDIEREVSAARKLGESEGEVRGKAMGEVVGEAKIILKMNHSGMSPENIASITGKDLDEINAILEGKVPVLG